MIQPEVSRLRLCVFLQLSTETKMSGARFHRAEHVKNVLHVRKTTVISAAVLTHQLVHHVTAIQSSSMRHEVWHFESESACRCDPAALVALMFLVPGPGATHLDTACKGNWPR